MGLAEELAELKRRLFAVEGDIVTLTRSLEAAEDELRVFQARFELVRGLDPNAAKAMEEAQARRDRASVALREAEKLREDLKAKIAAIEEKIAEEEKRRRAQARKELPGAASAFYEKVAELLQACEEARAAVLAWADKLDKLATDAYDLGTRARRLAHEAGEDLQTSSALRELEGALRKKLPAFLALNETDLQKVMWLIELIKSGGWWAGIHLFTAWALPVCPTVAERLEAERKRVLEELAERRAEVRRRVQGGIHDG